MLLPTASLAVGILAGMAGAPVWVAGIMAVPAFLTAFILTYIGRNPAAGIVTNRLHYIWIALIFLSLGIISHFINKPYQIEGEMGRLLAVRGDVLSTATPTSGDRAVLEVRELVDSSGNRTQVNNCRMILRGEDALGISVGDEVLIHSAVDNITDPPNIFATGYADYMARKGIYYSIRCKKSDISILDKHNSAYALATSIRDRLETGIEKTALSKPTQNFLITVLLGDRAYLNPDMRAQFADAGISHMLALSGMHVAIIAGIIMWLLFPINFSGHYKIRLVLAGILLLVYTFITGWAPSTLRATLMALSVTVCILLERKNSGWNALLLAVFIILVFNPLSLLDTGLQLSFLCVASLIFFVNPLNPVNHHEHPVLYRIFAVILTTLAATLGTWCVTARYFGSVPVLFLPANLVALPLLPAYLTASLVYFALSSIGMEPVWFSTVIDWFPKTLQALLRYMAGEDGHALSFSPSLLSVTLWLIFISLAAIWINGRRTKLKGGACIATGLLFFLSIPFSAGDGKPDGYIVRTSPEAVTIHTRTSGKEETLQYLRQGIYHTECAGQSIIIIDAPVSCNTETIKAAAREGCDLMVLASGAADSLSTLRSIVRPQCCVIHTSIRRERESRLVHEADSIGLRVHSIRLDGPYRFLADS